MEHPERPPLVGEPLDPRFLQFTEELRGPSRAEWQRRLDQVNSTAQAIPLGQVDPGKDLVVLVPGMGTDFRDMQALSQLQDTYQVAILISDHSQPWDHGGRYLARALEQFAAYRNALGKANGVNPGRLLRLIGHSAGTLTSQMMLYDLVQRGVLSDSQDSLFSKVCYWAIDGPWRGVDFPWIVQFTGLKYLGRLAVYPPFRLTRGVQSVINRLGPLMSIVTEDLGLPEGVIVIRHIYATGMYDTIQRFRHLEPVSCILWEELAENEGAHLYRFLRKHKTPDEMKSNVKDLQSFSPTRLTWRKGLQNLMLKLMRDYPQLVMDLRQLAIESTVEDFGVKFNSVITHHIRTYPGQHTRFMWTAPEFMEDMRRELAEVGEDQAPALGEAIKPGL